jgi:hypothetical protein
MSSARFKPEWLESRTAGMCCIQTNKCRVAMQVVSSAKGGEENTRLRAVYAIANLAGDMGYRRFLVEAGVVNILVPSLALDEDLEGEHYADKALGLRLNYGAALALTNLMSSVSVATHYDDRVQARSGRSRGDMDAGRREIVGAIEAAGGVDKLVKLMQRGSRQAKVQACTVLRLLGLQSLMCRAGEQEMVRGTRARGGGGGGGGGR